MIFTKQINNVFITQSGIMIFGSLVAGFLGYAFHIVTARFLEVARYGDLQALLSLFVIFSVPTQAILLYAIQAVSSNYLRGGDFLLQLVLKMKGYVFLSMVVVGFLSILYVPIIKNYLNLPSILEVVVLVVVSCVGFLGALYQGVCIGKKEFFAVSFSGVINALLKLVFATLFLIYFGTVFSAVFAMLFASVFTLIYLSYQVFGGFSFNRFCSDFSFLKLSKLKKLFNKSKAVFLFSLFIALLTVLDVLLAKHFLTSHEAGLFGAFSVLGKIIFWIASSVIFVLFPRVISTGFSSNIEKQGVLALKNSYFIISLFGLSIVLLFSFLPKFIVSILFGARYIGFESMLWLFGVQSLFLSFISLEAHVAYVKKDKNLFLILSAIISLSVLVVSFFISHTVFGLVSSLSFIFGLGFFVMVVNRILSSRGDILVK